MLKNVVRYSVYLPNDVGERVRVNAEKLKVSYAAYIRMAVERMLDAEGLGSANLSRIAHVAEFNQLVLNEIVKRDFKDIREQLAIAAEDRVAQYHGK